jgi:hypothetical protein
LGYGGISLELLGIEGGTEDSGEEFNTSEEIFLVSG